MNEAGEGRLNVACVQSALTRYRSSTATQYNTQICRDLVKAVDGADGGGGRWTEGKGQGPGPEGRGCQRTMVCLGAQLFVAEGVE